MNKTTRAMVAERAGVSLPMVSYVINKSRPVSEKTKVKVLKAIEELHYVPDMVAQSMVTKKSKSLTIISNNITNPMYGEIILEFEKAAFIKGYSTNICGGFLDLDQYISTIVARRIDGLYFASIPEKVHQKDIDFLIDNGVKISCGNYLLPNEHRVNRLDLDYDEGMKNALEYLFNKGHRKIIYANGFNKDYKMDIRLKAFAKYLKLFLPNSEVIVFYGVGPKLMDNLQGYEVGKKIIESKVSFDAVICTSDMFAYGVMQALKDGGLQLPRDASIIGFENLFISNFTSPKLTSVSFDKQIFSQTLVHQLIDSINKNTISQKIIKMNIFERESVIDRC